MGDQIAFLANLFAVIDAVKARKDVFGKVRVLKKYQKAILAISALIAVVIVLYALKCFEVFSPEITQVVLNNYTINLNTGDSESLSATVLFSDNTTGHDAIWISNNEEVVHIEENGQITALSAGNATVTAQASNRKSTAYAECVVTVMDPLDGYTISVRRTSIENYVFISVQPKDDSVSQIILHAKAPSGKIYTPPIDEYDLYRFYAETGVWTVYATLESVNGKYEAHNKEDFVEIEIKDVSGTDYDALLAALPVYG